MQTTFLGAAAILAALGFAPPVSAETITFTGTVTSDSEYNLFGVSGYGNNTFLGDTFTDTFQLNTANGAAYIDPGYVQEYYGGSYFGVSSPVSSTATFGGQSASFAGSYYGDAYGGNSADYPGGIESFEVVDDNYNSNAIVLAGVSGYPSFQSATGYYGSASLSLSKGVDYGYVDANITSVTVTASAVPEPSTWAMMLLGFAGLGYAAYRKTKTERTAFA